MIKILSLGLLCAFIIFAIIVVVSAGLVIIKLTIETWRELNG